MEGLIFLAACVAIGLLASWVMQNDAAGPTDPTTGLFAMRSRVAPPKEASDEGLRRTRGRPGIPRPGISRPGIPGRGVRRPGIPGRS